MEFTQDKFFMEKREKYNTFSTEKKALPGAIYCSFR